MVRTLAAPPLQFGLGGAPSGSFRRMPRALRTLGLSVIAATSAGLSTIRELQHPLRARMRFGARVAIRPPPSLTDAGFDLVTVCIPATVALTGEQFEANHLAEGPRILRGPAVHLGMSEYGWQMLIDITGDPGSDTRDRTVPSDGNAS